MQGGEKKIIWSDYTLFKTNSITPNYLLQDQILTRP